MESSVDNIKLGACIVSFGEQFLGLTKGGVEVTISSTTYNINTDQTGGTSLNEFISSRTITVKVPLAESQLELFSIVTPGTSYVDGTTSDKVVGTTGVGQSLRRVSDALVLHPKNLDLTDFSEDLIIPLASPKGDYTFAYKHDEEKIYTIEFTGYVDLDTGVLFTIGEEYQANGFRLEDGSSLILEDGSALKLES